MNETMPEAVIPVAPKPRQSPLLAIVLVVLVVILALVIFTLLMRPTMQEFSYMAIFLTITSVASLLIGFLSYRLGRVNLFRATRGEVPASAFLCVMLANMTRFVPGIWLLLSSRAIHPSIARIDRAVAQLGGKLEIIAEYCVEVNALENEADRVCREAISRLFDEEKDPIQLIKWKEIYETLERATDKCEDAANILESVVVKNA